MVNKIFQNKVLNQQSREKIKSAFHFYRGGRDSEQSQNKFLNWWTALEYLTRTGEKGEIITETEKRVVAALCLDYSLKHLRSYGNALHFCRLNLTEGQQAQFHKTEYRDLSLCDFFQLIRDPTEFSEMIGRLGQYPALAFHLTTFRAQTNDAISLKAWYERHERHLRWHINRIWRVRCNIVHSAEYSMNLTLLSANLEYYLKYLISLILDGLTRNSAIGSLVELYDRIDYSYGCLRKDLEAGKMGVHEELLKDMQGVIC